MQILTSLKGPAAAARCVTLRPRRGMVVDVEDGARAVGWPQA